MTKNPPIHNQPVPRYESAYYEDEISLVDIWLVLVRRRAIIAGIVALCVMAGGVFAIFKPASYEYSTTIEIGTRVSDGSLVVVEPAESLLAKINETYIPLVRSIFLADNHNLNSVPEIEAHVPKGGQIVVLTSKGVVDDETLHVKLQSLVVERVHRDHNRIISVIRKDIEIQSQAATAKLEELNDQKSLIRARETRLKDLAKLLDTRADTLRSDLLRATENRLQAVKEVTDESRAMTLLMLDSDIQQLHQRLAETNERLTIEVAESQDQIIKNLADVDRAQQSQKNAIGKLEIQLSNLRETQALYDPIRSLSPVGPGSKLILVLSVVLGIMAGLLVALFFEFLSRVRSESIEKA